MWNINFSRFRYFAGKIVLYILIFLIIFFNLSVFIWMLLSSFKSPQELYSLPIKYLPQKIEFFSYRNILSDHLFLHYLFNSITIASLTTFFTVLFGAFFGYAVSRLKLRLGTILLFFLLIATMFPQITFLIPLYELFSKAGLISNPLALVLPYTTFNLPLVIWIMTKFFSTIPKEIEEQAMVDGFSRGTILRKIIFPISFPAVIGCGILVFIGPFAWGEFLFALTYMIKDSSKTLPVGIALLSGSSIYEVPWSQLCAVAVMVTLPVVIFIILLQTKKFEGLIKLKFKD